MILNLIRENDFMAKIKLSESNLRVKTKKILKA